MRAIHFSHVVFLMCLSSGCVTVDRVSTDPMQCIVVENGSVKNLYVVRVLVHSIFSNFVPAIYPPLSVLSDSKIAEDDRAAGDRLRKSTPSSRILFGAENMVWGRTIAFRVEQEDHVDWIISNAPLVVAIGTDTLPKDAAQGAAGMGIPLLSTADSRRLVTKLDVDRMVTDLFIFSEDNPNDKEPQHISLTPPQTISQAMATIASKGVSK
jgi:hypothetical protein